MTSVDKAFIFVSIGISVAAAIFVLTIGVSEPAQISPTLVQQGLSFDEEEIPSYVELSDKRINLPESRHSPHTLQVSGYVQEYLRGTSIKMIIQYPDSSEEEQRIIAKKTGEFGTQFVLTNEHPPGSYKIEIKYGDSVTSGAFHLLEETPPLPSPEPSTEPLTEVKTSSYIELNSYEFEKSRSGGTWFIISGEVENYQSGQAVYVTLVRPDNTEEDLKLRVSNDNSFKATIFAVDNTIMAGTYTVKASYMSEDFIPVEFKVYEPVEASEIASGLGIQIEPQIQEQIELKIPEWIKDNADWWAADAISQSDFVNALQYLIKERIIVIPDLQKSGEATGEAIPDWVKSNAGWWAAGQVSDNEFVNAIQFLIKEGIIKV